MNLFACAINNSTSHNSKPDKLPNHLIRSSWEINGRIILQFEEEAVSAKLNWLQDDDLFKCTLSGPLGMDVVVFEGDNSGIHEITSDGNLSNLQRILEKNLPILDIKYWLLGIPNPRSIYRQITHNEDYVEFDQNSWKIKINKYQRINSYDLPKNIQIRNSAIRLKISIDKWRL